MASNIDLSIWKPIDIDFDCFIVELQKQIDYYDSSEGLKKYGENTEYLKECNMEFLHGFINSNEEAKKALMQKYYTFLIKRINYFEWGELMRKVLGLDN